MPPFVLTRQPRTDDELHLLVRALWGVTIPRTPVCPDHVPPFVAFADAFFGRNSLRNTDEPFEIALWHGSRGFSGKSYLLSVLGQTKAVVHGSGVSLLGGSFEQSKNIHKHMKALWAHPDAPADMLVNETAVETQLSNGAKIQALTASQKTVRGPHEPFLELDEIDEMEQDIFDAALGQPMEQVNWLGERIEPFSVACSTWQHPSGTFTEVKRRAETEGWPIYSWCFLETSNPIDGWLSPDAIERKRRTVPKAMWEAEYLLSEPSIGNRAFDTEAVNRAFSLPFEPISRKEEKDYEEFVFERPDKHGRYVAGADWGRQQDFTCVAVGRIDCTPHRLVYYLRVNRRPYPVMIGYFNQAIKRYRAAAAHDNTGLGTVVDDYTDTSAVPFTMTGDRRAALLSAYVSAIENDQWRFPAVPTAFYEMKYARYGDLFSGQAAAEARSAANAAGKVRFHLPDTVAAMSLMHHMAERYTPAVAPIVVKPSTTPSKTEALFMVRQPEPESEVEPIADPQAFSLVV